MSVPSLAEMAAAAARNRGVAEQQVQRVKQSLEREPDPGPERDRLLVDLSRYRAEFDHWASYVAYYRLRASREGAGAIPRLTWHQERQRLSYVKPAPAGATPDPRLPREPGDDGDDGDDDAPF